MKRIYLYFKEKIEKEEFSSRGMRIFLFWGLGLFSTIWFLVRVIPKPSRANYPCMQTAAPLMSAFVMYLLSFTGVWVSPENGNRSLCICRSLFFRNFDVGRKQY